MTSSNEYNTDYNTGPIDQSGETPYQQDDYVEEGDERMEYYSGENYQDAYYLVSTERFDYESLIMFDQLIGLWTRICSTYGGRQTIPVSPNFY